MISVNHTEVSVNLTRDPETITTPAGTIITTITIPNNYLSTAPDGSKIKEINYLKITAYYKLAEI